ncbi:NAD(P)/FAD-dependent oxidoreductase [Streptomyces sp. PsTaAH-124]|uniref:NAD(P)/FAD-dependent oxidoreductase n=1 Tax=Streptomyces sp. PsTaAH-124 TaxID=1157638 RepID=UPI000362DB6D|nr:FAD-dependent oxidoreductase [Streptomyces sp. PsTaAH-124]
MDVDVVVVGAGVIGCMTAHEIVTRRPGTSVVVLDQDTIGSGASHRSAGLHFPRGATERVRRMAARSQDAYTALLARYPDLPVRPLPMTVVASAGRAAELRAAYLPSARLRPVPGPPDDRVLLPPGTAAWQGDGCQYADVSALTQFLARRLRGRAAFHEGVRVTGVHPGERAVEVVLSTGRTLTAKRALLAPGPWLAAPAWQGLVAPLGARVKKIVAMHLDVPPRDGDHAIVFHDEDAFLLPLHHRGHWLFSYTCPEWDVDPRTVTEGVSARNLAEARAVLGRYAPALVGDCVSGRVFCDAYGPAHEPLVTALDPHGRLVFAGAAGGSGYRLAPALAAEAADLLDPAHPAHPAQEAQR